MEEDFNLENIKPKYPDMVPLKLALNPEKLQIALIFLKTPNSKKKTAFVIELNNLILLKDPIKIFEQIIINYGDIFYPKKISLSQLVNWINNLMEFFQKNLEDEENF